MEFLRGYGVRPAGGDISKTVGSTIPRREQPLSRLLPGAMTNLARDWVRINLLARFWEVCWVAGQVLREVAGRALNRGVDPVTEAEYAINKHSSARCLGFCIARDRTRWSRSVSALRLVLVSIKRPGTYDHDPSQYLWHSRIEGLNGYWFK
jgi:hypothetical protein